MSNNNLILNRFFTQYVFSELTLHHNNKIYNSIIEQYLKNESLRTNSQIITKIYDYMDEHYRNEYFYLNTLFNNILLGRHSLNTTTALTQIPIGKSKADLVLINGKAVVYEIKTELDTFERLESQINDYYKAFNHVYVVTCEQNQEKLEKLLANTSVGICILNRNKRLQFPKEAVEYKEKMTHEALFKVLHKNEFINIILKYHKKIPDVLPFFFYEECLHYFKKIPLDEAYALALKQLKKRNQALREYFSLVPYELKSLLYFYNAKERDYIALQSFLNCEYRG